MKNYIPWNFIPFPQPINHCFFTPASPISCPFPLTTDKPGTLLPPYPYCDFTTRLCERKCCPPPEQEDEPQTLPINPTYEICKYSSQAVTFFLFHKLGPQFHRTPIVTPQVHCVSGTVAHHQCPSMRKWWPVWWSLVGRRYRLVSDTPSLALRPGCAD